MEHADALLCAVSKIFIREALPGELPIFRSLASPLTGDTSVVTTGATDFKLSDGIDGSCEIEGDINFGGDDSLRIRDFIRGGDDGIAGVPASGKNSLDDGLGGFIAKVFSFTTA